MIEEVRAMVGPLARRIGAMFSRGILRRVDDTTSIQSVQVEMLAGELRTDVPRWQPYGLSSNPHAGAECAVLHLGGQRSHSLVFMVDDRRYRLTGLQSGEVALYTDEGDHIVLKRGNVIEMVAATKIVMTTPRLEVTGDIVDRTGSGNTRTVKGMRDVYNGHGHAALNTAPTQTM